MTKTKSTKRALLMSALALLMCVSMLIGSTFAWFTDSVTVSGNKIQSGTLDIALEMWNGTAWVNAEGETLNFISANGETDILWEPGCTYQLPKLRVVNKGNLAAKYQVQVTGIAGDAKLNEAIKWYGYYEVNQQGVQRLQRLPWDIFASQNYMVTPAGETWGMNDDKSEFQIEGVMDKNAGNEYQGLTIEGVSITVVATQATYEYDSKDNQYDLNAEYPEVEVIAAEDLATVLTPDANGVITIDKDYVVTGEWTSFDIDTGNVYDPIADKIVVNGNGHTISGLTKALLDGSVAGKVTINDLTIKDSTITATNDLGTGAFIEYRTNQGGGSLTMTNCHAVNVTVNSNSYAGALVGYCSGDAVSFTDCTVTNCTINGANSVGGIVGQLQSEGTFTNCKVTNTTLASTDDGDWRVGAIIGTANASAKTLTGCTESGNTLSQTGKTAPGHNLYGRIVSPGTLTIDGVAQ